MFMIRFTITFYAQLNSNNQLAIKSGECYCDFNRVRQLNKSLS